MRDRLIVLVLSCAALACRPARHETPAAPAAQPPAPPTLRLGTDVRPARCALDLTLVPSAERFSGRVTFDVDVARATGTIWLNASDLHVTGAEVFGKKARVVPGGDEFVGLSIEPAVGPGKGTVVVDYDAPLSAHEDAGLFRQSSGGDWYVFTQFEAVDARHAFPCFDEPSFKIPWKVTLHVPKSDVALANAPSVAEVDEPGDMKRVEFAETKPLPSYLVAVAVGPFDVVDAGKAGANGTPVRIITPRGRGAEAAWAVEATPQVLVRLEEYFGSPYPYEKLDCVAVPQKGGAMENAGLVTYSEPLILARREDDTIGRRRSYASVCAHETAHMWFGDLVTMAWWDDLWLNEAFATWMARKLLIEWKPEWRGDVDVVTGRSRAMVTDSLTTARRIRQPITSKHDIENAFDGITYGKGAAVISMFESWVGEDKFRDGVRRYLKEHEGGNATADDFLSALSAASGKDIAPAFSTFLDQPGAPLVSVELACGEGAAKLVLSQRRYLPDGSPGASEAQAATWRVPFCVRYGPPQGRAAAAASPGAAGRTCTAFEGATGEVLLPVEAGCPEWLLPNAGEIGYYRVQWGGDLLARLLDRGWTSLTRPERVGVVGDVKALVDGGLFSAGDALALVPRLAREDDREIQSIAVDIAASVDDHLVPDALRSRYEKFILDTFGARARGLGLTPRAHEDEETTLLRPTLVGFVAGTGEDERLVAEASRLASKALDDESAVSPEMMETILAVAAQHGDRALFDRLHAAARAAPDRRHRSRYLRAMASFRDPALVRAAMDVALTDEFDIREASTLWNGPLFNRRTHDLAFAFVRDHYDTLLERLPRDSRSRLLRAGGFACDPKARQEVAAFFGPRAESITGGPRDLAQDLERIDLCIARQRAQAPAVAKFLESQ